MEVFWWFIAAALVFTLAKNIWVRVKWWVFGIKPMILDEVQLDIAVKQGGDEWQRYVKWRGKQGSDFKETWGDLNWTLQDHICLRNYSRWLIQHYIKLFMLPQVRFKRNVGKDGPFTDGTLEVEDEQPAPSP